MVPAWLRKGFWQSPGIVATPRVAHEMVAGAVAVVVADGISVIVVVAVVAMDPLASC